MKENTAADHAVKQWKYAPVIIPTCNRVQHLSSCLESLNQNKYAEETEVYISVDYPPGEKYVAGHAAVIDYLEHFKGSNHFKKLHIYIQEQNLGVSQNFRFVREQAESEHECYISTEDDNVFAPNFLEYCNAGLRQFKDDESICCICGYNDAAQDYADGKSAAGDAAENEAKILLRRYYEPYGTAHWKAKADYSREWLTKENLYSCAMDFGAMMKLRKYNQSAFNLFVMGFLVSQRAPYVDENGNPNEIDVMKSIFLFFNSKYAVFPSRNLAHSNGNDGSGVNVTDDCPDTRPITGQNMAFDGELKIQIDSAARENRGAGSSSRVRQYLRSQRPTAEYILWFWKNRKFRSQQSRRAGNK